MVMEDNESGFPEGQMSWKRDMPPALKVTTNWDDGHKLSPTQCYTHQQFKLAIENILFTDSSPNIFPFQVGISS